MKRCGEIRSSAPSPARKARANSILKKKIHTQMYYGLLYIRNQAGFVEAGLEIAAIKADLLRKPNGRIRIRDSLVAAKVRVNSLRFYKDINMIDWASFSAR